MGDEKPRLTSWPSFKKGSKERVGSVVLHPASFLTTEEIYDLVQKVVEETVDADEEEVTRRDTHAKLEKWFLSYSVEVEDDGSGVTQQLFGSQTTTPTSPLTPDVDDEEDEEDEESQPISRSQSNVNVNWRPPPLYFRDGSFSYSPTTETILTGSRGASKPAETTRSTDEESTRKSLEIPQTDKKGLTEEPLPAAQQPRSPQQGAHTDFYQNNTTERGEDRGSRNAEPAEEEKERRRILLQKVSRIAHQTTAEKSGRTQRIQSLVEWKAFLNLKSLYDEQEILHNSGPKPDSLRDIRKLNSILSQPRNSDSGFDFSRQKKTSGSETDQIKYSSLPQLAEASKASSSSSPKDESSSLGGDATTDSLEDSSGGLKKKSEGWQGPVSPRGITAGGTVRRRQQQEEGEEEGKEGEKESSIYMGFKPRGGKKQQSKQQEKILAQLREAEEGNGKGEEGEEDEGGASSWLPTSPRGTKSSGLTWGRSASWVSAPRSPATPPRGASYIGAFQKTNSFS